MKNVEEVDESKLNEKEVIYTEELIQNIIESPSGDWLLLTSYKNSK